MLQSGGKRVQEKIVHPKMPTAGSVALDLGDLVAPLRVLSTVTVKPFTVSSRPTFSLHAPFEHSRLKRVSLMLDQLVLPVGGELVSAWDDRMVRLLLGDSMDGDVGEVVSGHLVQSKHGVAAERRGR
jgi:uncharacterized Fe-S cluster-containing radical SAM superfamily enzyme